MEYEVSPTLSECGLGRFDKRRRSSLSVRSNDRPLPLIPMSKVRCSSSVVVVLIVAGIVTGNDVGASAPDEVMEDNSGADIVLEASVNSE